MRLRPIRRSARKRVVVDDAVAAYAEWRAQSAAVGDAYCRWLGATAIEEPIAFRDYTAPLDREEHAARRYAGLMRRAYHLPETGLAHQLAQVQVSSRVQ